MGRMTFTCGFNENRESGYLEMQEDGQPLARMYFDAATLEDLIRDLARCRSHLTEAVAPELDPGARIETERFPAWRVPDTHSGPGTVLALRHSGMGWLGFLLEAERAQAIGKALIETPPKQSS